MVLGFIQLSACPAYDIIVRNKILKIPGILKILMLTRKGNPVRPLRLCWPHAGRAHTFGIAPKVCKNSRPLQCNSIGRCTMLIIEPEPEQKGCFSYKDSEKRTPFCSFAVDRPGFYCAMFERHRHHHPILKILKILILTRKRDAVRPLRLCWPHAGLFEWKVKSEKWKVKSEKWKVRCKWWVVNGVGFYTTFCLP